ncbi:MAG: TolC family protein [bacterium]
MPRLLLKTRLFWVFGGLFFFLSCPSYSAPSLAPLNLSFQEALKIAQERHVEVIVAHERVQQALTRISQARAVLLPQLDGRAYEQRKTVNLKSMGIDIPLPGFSSLVGPFNTFDARVSLTQTILDPEAIERLRSSHAGERLSQANLRKTQQDALSLVATLYVNAERAQDAIALARALLKRSEDRARLARTRLALGLGTELEATQLNSELADQKSLLTQAIAEASERRLDLNAALGIAPETPLVFSRGKNDFSEKIFENPSLPFNGHPDIELARAQVVQNEWEKKAAQAQYYPKIIGTADYGASGSTPGEADGTYSYGAQLSIPIYKGGLRHARVQEATSKIRESEARLADTKEQVSAKILSAQEMLKKARALWQAAKADETAAKKQLSVAQDRSKIGSGTELETVEAKALWAQALDRQNEAKATYRLAQVNLARALGRMESLTE